MATLLSPGILAREIDLSLLVPNVATTETGTVGQFNWGPVEKPVLIDSEEELVQVFDKPTNDNADDWFTARNYLDYASNLWVVRMVDDSAANTALRAVNASANTGFLVKNDDVYEELYSDGELKLNYNTGDWIARYPGAKGNSLKVVVCDSAAAFQSNVTGTVTISAGSTSVTGTGTTFQSQIKVGDFLVANNEYHKVASITSNTALVLETKHVSGAAANTATRRWEYYYEVNTAPGTSTWAQNLNGANDEMHILVIDEDGLITGQPETVLEKYQYVSKASDASQANGEGNYYKNVINTKSEWIRWAGHPALSNIGSPAKNVTFGTSPLPVSYPLGNGRDGQAIGNDERIRGFDFFKSQEDMDVSILLGGAADTTLAVYIINSICEVRQDMIAFFSPPRSYVVDNKGFEAEDVITFRNTLPSTSYAAMDANWKYQYDRYNDVYRYVPLNGDVAGIHVRSSIETDDWWAAAGLNRGQVKNVIKLAWNPGQTDRDQLYKNGINPVVTFKGEGTVLFGQKTLLARPSAFDRINVRRLFIALKKSISKMARYYLFEFNDEITRRQFVNTVEPYLRDIKGRRGVTAYYVKCDSENNTPIVIDRNEFVASIFVKPNRVAEFIYLNFVAVATGVEFTEVENTI